MISEVRIKNGFFLILYILTSCSHSPVQSVLVSQDSIQDAYSIPNAQKELDAFIKAGAPNRSLGENGHEKAFQYLKLRFEEIAKNQKNSSVTIHPFFLDVDFAIKNYKNDFHTLVEEKFKKTSQEYKHWKKFTDSAIQFVNHYRTIKGKNIILEFRGTEAPNSILLYSAHYDTITNDASGMIFTPKSIAPGADDNASGVVALLNLAKYLSLHPPKQTIRLVAFDAEEIFFLGSYAYAKKLKEEILQNSLKVMGLINLEMIGWSSKVGPLGVPVVKIYTEEPHSKNLDADLKLVNMLKVNHPSALQVEVLQNGFNRSDHWSFWQLEIPAICITEDWENDFNSLHYHTDHDGLSTLNLSYLNEISNWIQSSIEK